MSSALRNAELQDKDISLLYKLVNLTIEKPEFECKVVGTLSNLKSEMIIRFSVSNFQSFDNLLNLIHQKTKRQFAIICNLNLTVLLGPRPTARNFYRHSIKGSKSVRDISLKLLQFFFEVRSKQQFVRSDLRLIY